MTSTLRYLPGFEAERRDLSRSQWYSPPELAESLWAWATPEGRNVERVLEPAAGRGALVLPAMRDRRVRRITACDIDPANVDALKELPRRGPRLSVVRGDFVTFTPSDRFDLCVQNPPFEDNQDVAFILHALRFSPIVCGIYRSAIVHGSTRFDRLWRNVDMTRIAYLVNRPKFGEGTGAISDFVAVEFMRRDSSKPRVRGECSPLKVEWW